MYEDRKAQALADWYKMMGKPEGYMTAQEQYEELLCRAEIYFREGFIDSAERKQLVIKATRRYAEAVEGTVHPAI
jgi:hypothetical protein